MRRTTASRRSFVGFLTILALTGFAGADANWAQNDAGSGLDAGNSWATALALPDYGSYSGTLLEHDTDAYVVSQASTMPACLNFSFTPTSADVLVVKATSGGVDKTASLAVAAGATQRGGLATNGYDSAGLKATLQDPELDGSHPYSFSLLRTGLTGSPPSAGHSISSASPLSGPCTPGVMSAANLANVNTYSLGSLQAGTTVVASLAATAGDLALQVVDGNGAALAQTSVNGVTTVQVPTTGAYYLSVQRTDLSVQDVQYLVGVIVGGPGCTPAC